MADWLLMFRPETYEIVKDKGVIGVLKMHRKRFAELKKGDRFITYISRSMIMDGYGKVTSKPFEDDSEIFPTKQRYPHRCKVVFDKVGTNREENKLLWALSIWPKELNTYPSNMLFCKGGFIKIAKSDYDMLRDYIDTGAMPDDSDA